jgi:LacI family transcriptional regulator
MATRSTINDVAKAAMVSTTTVSRYLNKRLSLPAETLERIERAIRDLDYRANVNAQRLISGATNVIGIATPDIGNPFYAALASAVEERAATFGYSVILCSTRNRLDQELGHIERLAARHVDGLLFLTNHGDDGSLRRAIGRRTDLVLLDEDVPGLDVPKIFVENENGGFVATRRLIEAGHTRIAHISGPKNLFSVRERHAGYRRALGESGLAPRAELVAFGRYDRAFGFEAAERLLSLPNPPTAIFAASDYLVVGVLDALRARGLCAPDDLSIVGFDDMPFASLMDPPITTIRQPIRLMGERGVEALVERLKNAEHNPEPVRLRVTLVERASVGPPAAEKRRIASSGRTGSKTAKSIGVIDVTDLNNSGSKP